MATRRPKATITDSLGRTRAASRKSWGKVETLPSGNLRASHSGPDGKRHFAPMTFTAREDAEGWLTKQRAAILEGRWTAQSGAAQQEAQAERAQTLAEYAEVWLKTDRNRKGEVKRPRTIDEYRRLLAGPLADLGALPLTRITARKVDAWYAEQAESGKLTQTSRAYSLLSTILKHAGERVEGLPPNPCRVQGGQVARTGRKVVPPTDAELATILATIPPRFRALVYLAAEAGLRYGEATDLRRSDIEVERDDDGKVVRVLVTVSHAVTRTASGFVSGKPKSDAGVRSVYVYGAAAESIAEHLRSHVSRFGDPLLFPATGDETGTRYLSQSTFHTPHWDNARRAAGRPDMPFHALRHRAGTVYVQHGATMAEAMTRLGHSSTAVAMRYQHATGRDAEIAARMAGTSVS